MDGRKLIYGERAARAAAHRAVADITSDRIRAVEQVVVAAKPAATLLRVAGNNPAEPDRGRQPRPGRRGG
jgi:maltose/moltooligosaccharide transporter